MEPRPAAQSAAGLSVQTHPGLTITGTTGAVYSVEYVTDLAQTNDPAAWRCLEYLQLPASPYLWADKSAPATGKRFYRAVANLNRKERKERRGVPERPLGGDASVRCG